MDGKGGIGSFIDPEKKIRPRIQPISAPGESQDKIRKSLPRIQPRKMPNFPDKLPNTPGYKPKLPNPISAPGENPIRKYIPRIPPRKMPNFPGKLPKIPRKTPNAPFEKAGGIKIPNRPILDSDSSERENRMRQQLKDRIPQERLDNQKRDGDNLNKKMIEKLKARRELERERAAAYRAIQSK